MPFDLLDRVLSWAFAKNPVLGFLVAIAIVMAAAGAVASLNQDRDVDPGAGQQHPIHSTAARNT